MSESKVKGKLKWWNSAKGFGFITLEDGRDAFAHYSAIVGTGNKNLDDDSTCEFVLVETPKGLQARDIVQL